MYKRAPRGVFISQGLWPWGATPLEDGKNNVAIFFGLLFSKLSTIEGSWAMAWDFMEISYI